MTTENHPSLAELARRLQDFYTRLEAIATRMETAYVTKEVYKLNNLLIEQKFNGAKEYADVLRRQSEEEINTLTERVKQLEDDKTWLVRLIVGAIILAIIGAVLAGSKAIGK